MYGLRASTEPLRLWPCGDVVIAAAGAGSGFGYLVKHVNSLGTGRWCP